jgi:hypothetical protein
MANIRMAMPIPLASWFIFANNPYHALFNLAVSGSSGNTPVTSSLNHDDHGGEFYVSHKGLRQQTQPHPKKPYQVSLSLLTLRLEFQAS